MGRLIVDRDGAARRPPNVARALVVIAALVLAAIVGAWIGGHR